MASPVPYPVVDDKDLDDAALWAVIDAAAAAASASSKSRKPLAIKYPNFHSPISKSNASPSLPKTTTNPSYYNYTEPDSKVCAEGEVLEEPWVFRPPRKIARTSSSQVSDTTSPLVVFRNVQRTPEKYLSPEIGRFTTSECSPGSRASGRTHEKETSASGHSLSAIFPSVSLFKEYQNPAMAVGGRYHFTLTSHLKSEIRRLSLMRIVMFSVLNLWFEPPCRPVGSQMDGVHVSGVRRDF